MRLSGIPIHNGIAIGRVMRYLPDYVEEKGNQEPARHVEEELERYRRAAEKVRQELKQLVRQASEAGQAHSDIFYAHVAMLEDEMLNAEIVDCITNQHMQAADAVCKVFERFETMLRHTEEPLIRERAGA